MAKRIRSLLPLYLCCLLLQGCSNAYLQNESADEATTGSLTLLLDWVSGDFDNRRQFESQTETPTGSGFSQSGFSHLGLQRRIVYAPQLGAHVLYAQINRRADPGDVYRQTLQVFEQDSEGTIRSRNLRFRDAEKHRDILATPGAFAALESAALKPALPTGCDPEWTFDGSEFTARIYRERCSMISRRNGKSRHIQSTEFVGPNTIRNEESGYRENGEQIFGLAPGVYYEFDRVRAAPEPGQ